MKKSILLLVAIISFASTLLAQVSVTITPPMGCPNTTHDVSVEVTNTSGFSIPASVVTYTIDITIYTDAHVALKNFNQSYTDGFANNSTRTYTVEDVPFMGPMTCTVEGTVSANVFGTPYSFPINETYIVSYPPDITITESPTGTLNVDNMSGVEAVRYYKDGNYTSHVDESAGGVFTPSTSGTYTAKAYAPATGCISQNPSNGIAIVVSSVQKFQNIELAVYPNPVVSTLIIDAKISDELSYQLYDMNGKLIRSGSFNQHKEINVADLKAGTYMLAVENQYGKVASYTITK